MSTKVVVIGGTGRIGSKVVEELNNHGCEAVAAAPDTGVNTITGEGLAEVIRGASAVVDVSDSPSFKEKEVMEFFTTSTRNLLACEAKAGVGHHIALSVVGTERLPESAYMRAKSAQERLIRESGIPYSIVHATQFFEFALSIADSATVGNEVRVPPTFIQPMAAVDVANAVVQVAVGAPLNGIVEVAGPQRFTFEDFIRKGLSAHSDSREVVVDADALYFGAKLGETTLVASGDAIISSIRFDDWLNAGDSVKTPEASAHTSLVANRARQTKVRNSTST